MTAPAAIEGCQVICDTEGLRPETQIRRQKAGVAGSKYLGNAFVTQDTRTIPHVWEKR
jgi:hypothetical protein